MHGKILRYSQKTKSGVIINASKKIFELREDAWHDPKMMPQAGLLVEYRCGDDGYRVVDCHASKFQDFDEKGHIQEIDFWKTDTDEELQNRLVDAKASIARNIFAQTDYTKLTAIKESIGIQDSIQNYFREQFNALKMLESYQKAKMALEKSVSEIEGNGADGKVDSKVDSKADASAANVAPDAAADSTNGAESSPNTSAESSTNPSPTPSAPKTNPEDAIDPNKSLISYLHLKDYLNKAVDYIIFADKSFSPDMFYEEIQIIKRLEHGYRDVLASDSVPIDRVYNDFYLEEQYHLKGVQKAISTFKERRLQYQNKIRVGTMEIRNVQNKIASKKGNPKELEERIKNVQAVVKKTEEGLKANNEILLRLVRMDEEFQAKNLKVYGVVFKKIRDILLARIKKAMDVAATALDDKLWEMGMKSDILTQAFFKPSVSGSFCAITFLYQSIRLLDPSKVSNNAKQMATYCQSYKKKYHKNFLIFSEREDFIFRLKVKILRSHKDFVVISSQKEIELVNIMGRNKFVACYIDEDIKLKAPSDIIKTIERLKGAQDIKIEVLGLAEIHSLEKDEIIAAAQ